MADKTKLNRKQIAQKCYELHRQLWLQRILAIQNNRSWCKISITLPEELRSPRYLEADRATCLGCHFDNFSEGLSCESCLFKFTDIYGNKVTQCSDPDTVYDLFINEDIDHQEDDHFPQDEAEYQHYLENKLKWAWEIYYWPMDERWM